jgi:hypothetical protein
MIGQHGVATGARNRPPIRYDAIEECLLSVLKRARHYVRSDYNSYDRKNLMGPISMHSPRFGSGLAGGDWAEIEKRIHATFTGQGITFNVYDLPATVSTGGFVETM